VLNQPELTPISMVFLEFKTPVFNAPELPIPRLLRKPDSVTKLLPPLKMPRQ
jgi:hypothetical protein